MKFPDLPLGTLSVVVFLLIVGACSDDGTDSKDPVDTDSNLCDTNVDYETFAAPFFEANCLRCHSASLTDPRTRFQAPLGADYDTEDDIRRHREGIRQAVVIDGVMPPSIDLDSCDLERLEAYLDGLADGPCTPDCDGRACGSDGCGGSCGTCEDGEHCDPAGQCIDQCVPFCGTSLCGDDGCGGSCGTCGEGLSCDEEGRCVCEPGATCACVPDCSGRQCGDDGCGGSCGTCALGQSCDDGTCTGLVSFSQHVFPIFQDAGCSQGGACHGTNRPAEGLSLTTASGAYAAMVNVASAQCADRMIVLPGDATTGSYLVAKLLGRDMCQGSKMPKQGTLSNNEIQTIQTWIAEGAHDN